MDPTKEELLEHARSYSLNGRWSLGVTRLICDICDFHGRCDGWHVDLAYSLALDGEDVDELL